MAKSFYRDTADSISDKLKKGGKEKAQFYQRE